MPETYEQIKQKVYDEMQKADWVTFTTDIWTNQSKSCSLLSFTAHFILGSKRLKYILGASVLEEDHTGSYICEKLEAVIEEFKLENKIHMGISDNAKNVKCAMKIADFPSFGCMAHTIHPIVQESLAPYQEIKTKCISIVGHFKRSEQAYGKLKKYKKNVPCHCINLYRMLIQGGTVPT
ncbi:E3 SUMO-protein ligase ZBED1-like [Lucilia cuprina]|uniref:E3 SUMO-protein ligase ZBED1-like n=1 Tax=Lucilia cuprina TaxID=7375 RepID=UPI001F061785|nr:E3 SUMO-protein ligase ZBED1-like [Lucilia cuprina]